MFTQPPHRMVPWPISHHSNVQFFFFSFWVCLDHPTNQNILGNTISQFLVVLSTQHTAHVQPQQQNIGARTKKIRGALENLQWEEFKIQTITFSERLATTQRLNTNNCNMHTHSTTPAFFQHNPTIFAYTQVKPFHQTCFIVTT